MIVNELEVDLFPHELKTNILSSPRFKGICYLFMAYFAIFGGKKFCIVPSVITFIYAFITLCIAGKIQRESNLKHSIGDQYLPELSNDASDDIVTVISEYEPPSMDEPKKNEYYQVSVSPSAEDIRYEEEEEDDTNTIN